MAVMMCNVIVELLDDAMMSCLIQKVEWCRFAKSQKEAGPPFRSLGEREGTVISSMRHIQVAKDFEHALDFDDDVLQ